MLWVDITGSVGVPGVCMLMSMKMCAWHTFQFQARLCVCGHVQGPTVPEGFMGMKVGLDFHLLLAHPTYPGQTTCPSWDDDLPHSEQSPAG